MKDLLPPVAPALPEFRCRPCGKLLARAACQALQIKCPRCGVLNTLPQGQPRAERP